MTVSAHGQVGDALEVEAVTKSFAEGVPVLTDVSLTVAGGSTAALLGPSGCGKTTLLRLIAGLDQPDEGRVRVGDRELTGPNQFVPPESRRIGMVFQDWALFPHLSVSRNVGFGLPRSERRTSPRIDAALAMVGLDGLGERMPDTLSGGQQQRVALARALAPEPSVLLLDEPFSNLDASLRTQVRTDVHRLLVALGVTTVFVTHDQDEAFVLGDSVVVLSDGMVAQAGSPEDLYRRPKSRWLAGFVGQANFVDGVADGSTATTRFGTVTLLDECVGSVQVLIRPEHLKISAATVAGRDAAAPLQPAGMVEGEVELVEFVGHSTVYLIRIGDAVLRVRSAGLPSCSRGDRVGLQADHTPTVAFHI